MKKILPLLLVLLSFSAFAKNIQLVAAENFYGDVAKQMGGPYVQVTSIMCNPNQDPHLFSASPATAKAVANADLVVYNGIDYDPWMERLLAVSPKKEGQIIVIAQLLSKKTGDNPHLWYDPETMLLYAKTLARVFAHYDPAHRSYYEQQLTQFEQNFQELNQHIKKMKQRYANIPITATEPVFNYMADALGLKVLGLDFQLSIMNDTTPSATQIRSFEDNLRNKKVRVLIYNNQVSNPLTARMQLIAQQAGVPIVGVSESEPEGKTYVQWMLGELSGLDEALGK